MKHTKSISLLLVLFLLCALLAACGGGSSPMEEAAGLYQGQYTKLVGDETKEEAVFSLELRGDGTGTHKRDDLEIKITWTLEGEAVTMQESFMGMKMDYTGTLKDGVLHLFNGDPSDVWTCEYVYQKQ